MARIARVVVPGYPHHVTQRGNRRQQTFFCNDDYQAYVDLIATAKDVAGVSILAYCLMPNHVHLVAVPDTSDSLADLFKDAHRRYTRRINFRERWRGHLWQERFHSCVMDEPHLLAAVRYIELNPVRAGLCNSPSDWPWSSVHAHLAALDDALTTTRPMLQRVGNWQPYLRGGGSDETLHRLRQHARTGRPLGNDAFVASLESITGRSLRPKKPGRKPNE
jgi:putative transposase